VSVKVDNHKPWLVCTDKAIIATPRAINGSKSGESVTFKWKAAHWKSFYTSSSGYQLGIKVYVDGYGAGEGTHVSVFTKVLEGHYDNQLHWPFLGTVTYELLNQLGDDNHHKVDVTYDASSNMVVGGSKGRPKFVPRISLDHNPATNTQYLLDDTLYFRVSVKVHNHKPWLVCTHS